MQIIKLMTDALHFQRFFSGAAERRQRKERNGKMTPLCLVVGFLPPWGVGGVSKRIAFESRVLLNSLMFVLRRLAKKIRVYASSRRTDPSEPSFALACDIIRPCSTQAGGIII